MNPYLWAIMNAGGPVMPSVPMGRPVYPAKPSDQRWDAGSMMATMREQAEQQARAVNAAEVANAPSVSEDVGGNMPPLGTPDEPNPFDEATTKSIVDPYNEEVAKKATEAAAGERLNNTLMANNAAATERWKAIAERKQAEAAARDQANQARRNLTTGQPLTEKPMSAGENSLWDSARAWDLPIPGGMLNYLDRNGNVVYPNPGENRKAVEREMAGLQPRIDWANKSPSEQATFRSEQRAALSDQEDTQRDYAVNEAVRRNLEYKLANGMPLNQEDFEKYSRPEISTSQTFTPEGMAMRSQRRADELAKRKVLQYMSMAKARLGNLQRGIADVVPGAQPNPMQMALQMGVDPHQWAQMMNQQSLAGAEMANRRSIADADRNALDARWKGDAELRNRKEADAEYKILKDQIEKDYTADMKEADAEPNLAKKQALKEKAEARKASRYAELTPPAGATRPGTATHNPSGMTDPRMGYGSFRGLKDKATAKEFVDYARGFLGEGGTLKKEDVDAYLKANPGTAAALKKQMEYERRQRRVAIQNGQELPDPTGNEAIWDHLYGPVTDPLPPQNKIPPSWSNWPAPGSR